MPAVTSASQALANVRVVGAAACGRLVRQVGQKLLSLCVSNDLLSICLEGEDCGCDLNDSELHGAGWHRRLHRLNGASDARSACAHGVLKPNVIGSHMFFTFFNCSSKPFQDDMLFNRIQYSIEKKKSTALPSQLDPA